MGPRRASRDGPSFPQRSAERRKWLREAVGVTVLRLRRLIVAPTLIILLSCFQRADAQNYFGHCFSSLSESDSDSDGQLSPDEFLSFVVAYTTGGMEAPLPTIILEPYQAASAAGQGVVLINPASQDVAMGLCHQVKQALMIHYGVEAGWDACIGALKVGDQGPPAGFLGPEQEYIQFLGSLTGEEYKDVQAIPLLVKAAFDDMAVDGMIAGPKGGEYLLEFCERVVLAATIEASKPKVVATLAPTSSPTPPNVVPTEAPTAAPVTVGAKKVNVVQAAAAPKAEFELTEPRFRKCLKDLLLSDINRNDLLERKEYSRFVNRLHNEVFQTNIRDSAEEGTERAYAVILADQGKRVAPSIKGSKPGQRPNRQEKKRLRFVCKVSHEMIRNEHREGVGEESDITGDKSDSEEDFAKFFRACKVSLFVSDKDRNSKIDQGEFTGLIHRLVPAGDKAEYRDLDRIFQDSFRVASSGGSISVIGSSPAAKPTLAQISNLQFVCREIKTSMAAYEKKQMSLAASNNLQVRNNHLDDQFPDLSEEFFRTCTMGMFIADRDRDSRLSSSEFFSFVERLTFGALDADTYQDLHPLFQATQDTFSDDDGYVDVTGSKPGSASNYDEEKSLRKICNGLDDAIADVRDERLFQQELEEANVATSETSPDVEAAEASSATEPPIASKSKTLDDKKAKEEETDNENISDEANSLSEASTGREESQAEKGEQEKVSNRQKEAKNSKTKNPQEEAKNSKPKDKNKAKVKGKMKPKKPKQEKVVDYSVSDSFKTLKTTTLLPPPEDMSYTELSRCKKKLGQADSDGFRNLDQDEYFAFIVALSRAEVDARSFDQLPETLLTPFRAFSINDEFVQIAGAGVGEETSVSEMEHLQAFCSATFTSLFYLENPVSEEQDCIASMISADEDLNTWLSETEYVGFLNIWAKNRYQNLEFGDLPYSLRADFEWGKSPNGQFVVATSALEATHYSDVLRLEAICERLADALSDRTPSVTLDDHCRKSIIASDVDRDGFIGRREFMSLISLFTDRLWKPAQRFKAIHPILQTFFEETQNTEGLINVQSAKMGDSSLVDFCERFESYINESQRNQLQVDHCRNSLYLGDSNGDMHLSPPEYVDMLYGIIVYPGLTDSRPPELTFEMLRPEAQTSYRASTTMSGDIDLKGFFSPALSQDVQERLRVFCDDVYDKAIPKLVDEELKVYNSFLISDDIDVNATDLGGYHRRVVNKAYQRFVSATNLEATSMTAKGRRLAVVGTTHSAQVYDEESTVCPSSYGANSTCQTLYASFKAIIVGETDPVGTGKTLSSVTQDAIDNGSLQKEIVSLDPSFPGKVLRSSFPLTPSESASLAKARAERAAAALRTRSVFMLSLSGAWAFIFVVIGCYYGRRLKQRELDDVMNSKTLDGGEKKAAVLDGYHEQDNDSDGDDDDMAGMNLQEKKRARRENRLRQSIVPLLLSQSYHLPDYNYGEDLFQYIYNRHPLLGLVWRHPLHPIGFNVRVICLFGSLCFGFAASNIIFIGFVCAGWDFDRSYIEVATDVIAVTGKDAFDGKMEAAATTLTNGNIAIWSIGSIFHALFDSSLWSMATCGCLGGGFVEKMDKYSRLGALTVSSYVVGVAVIAFASAGTRLVLTSENGEDTSIDLEPSVGFMTSMVVEVVAAFFFYHPLLSFMMFSGLLKSFHEEMFGGRRYELLRWEKSKKREVRCAQRKKLLDSKLNAEEFGAESTRLADASFHQYEGAPENDYHGSSFYPNQYEGVKNGFEDDYPPDYSDEVGSENEASTCNEMTFEPRMHQARRHSASAESVSEREPVHRKWQDDLDAGSVSAWSRSSWLKYGYDDFEVNDHAGGSDISRASSLSYDDNLPDSILALIEDPFSANNQLRRQSSKSLDSSHSSATEERAGRSALHYESSSSEGRNPRTKNRSERPTKSKPRQPEDYHDGEPSSSSALSNSDTGAEHRGSSLPRRGAKEKETTPAKKRRSIFNSSASRKEVKATKIKKGTRKDKSPEESDIFSDNSEDDTSSASESYRRKQKRNDEDLPGADNVDSCKKEMKHRPKDKGDLTSSKKAPKEHDSDDSSSFNSATTTDDDKETLGSTESDPRKVKQVVPKSRKPVREEPSDDDSTDEESLTIDEKSPRKPRREKNAPVTATDIHKGQRPGSKHEPKSRKSVSARDLDRSSFYSATSKANEEEEMISLPSLETEPPKEKKPERKSRKPIGESSDENSGDEGSFTIEEEPLQLSSKGKKTGTNDRGQRPGSDHETKKHKSSSSRDRDRSSFNSATSKVGVEDENPKGKKLEHNNSTKPSGEEHSDDNSTDEGSFTVDEDHPKKSSKEDKTVASETDVRKGQLSGSKHEAKNHNGSSARDRDMSSSNSATSKANEEDETKSLASIETEPPKGKKSAHRSRKPIGEESSDENPPDEGSFTVDEEPPKKSSKAKAVTNDTDGRKGQRSGSKYETKKDKSKSSRERAGSDSTTDDSKTPRNSQDTSKGNTNHSKNQKENDSDRSGDEGSYAIDDTPLDSYQDKIDDDLVKRKKNKGRRVSRSRSLNKLTGSEEEDGSSDGLTPSKREHTSEGDTEKEMRRRSKHRSKKGSSDTVSSKHETDEDKPSKSHRRRSRSKNSSSNNDDSISGSDSSSSGSRLRRKKKQEHSSHRKSLSQVDHKRASHVPASPMHGAPNRSSAPNRRASYITGSPMHGGQNRSSTPNRRTSYVTGSPMHGAQNRSSTPNRRASYVPASPMQGGRGLSPKPSRFRSPNRSITSPAGAFQPGFTPQNHRRGSASPKRSPHTHGSPPRMGLPGNSGPPNRRMSDFGGSGRGRASFGGALGRGPMGNRRQSYVSGGMSPQTNKQIPNFSPHGRGTPQGRTGRGNRRMPDLGGSGRSMEPLNPRRMSAMGMPTSGMSPGHQGGQGFGSSGRGMGQTQGTRRMSTMGMPGRGVSPGPQGGNGHGRMSGFEGADRVAHQPQGTRRMSTMGMPSRGMPPGPQGSQGMGRGPNFAGGRGGGTRRMSTMGMPGRGMPPSPQGGPGMGRGPNFGGAGQGRGQTQGPRRMSTMGMPSRGMPQSPQGGPGMGRGPSFGGACQGRGQTKGPRRWSTMGTPSQGIPPGGQGNRRMSGFAGGGQMAGQPQGNRRMSTMGMSTGFVGGPGVAPGRGFQQGGRGAGSLNQSSSNQQASYSRARPQHGQR